MAIAALNIGIRRLQQLEEQRQEEEEERDRQPSRRRKRWWTRQWILRRPLHGAFEKLMVELDQEDVASFANFVRFTPQAFNEVLQNIEALITKKDTFWRKALPPGLKLAITLRYLATGDSYQSLAYNFRVAKNTICLFIPQVCQAILQVYADEMMSCPITAADWKKVAKEFELKWNLPHCCGAIDGKHVAIRCPGKTGSLYFNYKGFFSIVLMALSDANYRLLYAVCGFNGASSDGGVFNRIDLKEALEDGSIGLPPAEPIRDGDRPLPYFIVGDEAFPLKTWLMKPLPQRNMTRPQRIFNYRLSRARRVVENAFGLLSARFRCLLTSMPQKPETVTNIVLTCCCLHNFLITKRLARVEMAADYEDPHTHEVVPGTWREAGALPDLGGADRGRYGNREAKEQREYLVDYVNSPDGSVPWQDDRI